VNEFVNYLIVKLEDVAAPVNKIFKKFIKNNGLVR
jgi:hypothetical protein